MIIENISSHSYSAWLEVGWYCTYYLLYLIKCAVSRYTDVPSSSLNQGKNKRLFPASTSYEMTEALHIDGSDHGDKQ